MPESNWNRNQSFGQPPPKNWTVEYMLYSLPFFPREKLWVRRLDHSTEPRQPPHHFKLSGITANCPCIPLLSMAPRNQTLPVTLAFQVRRDKNKFLRQCSEKQKCWMHTPLFSLILPSARSCKLGVLCWSLYWLGGGEITGKVKRLFFPF